LLQKPRLACLVRGTLERERASQVEDSAYTLVQSHRGVHRALHEVGLHHLAQALLCCHQTTFWNVIKRRMSLKLLWEEVDDC
jgi:hypothetical protein